MKREQKNAAQYISGRVEFISPAKAAEMLRSNQNNRCVNKVQVARYAQAITNGQWQLNGESITVGRTGRLLNGQHRLLAVIEAKRGIYSFVVRGVDEDTFVTIDSGKARTDRDVFSIMNVPNYTNVSAAIGCFMKLRSHNTADFISGGNGSAGQRQTRIDRRDFYLANEETILQAVRRAAVLYDKCRILKTSVIAGMMLYLQLDMHYDHDTVFAFFKGVCDTAANPTCKAILLLRERLLRNKLGAVALRSSAIQKLIIKAWNAYIQGKNVKCLRYNEEADKDIWFCAPTIETRIKASESPTAINQ